MAATVVAGLLGEGNGDNDAVLLMVDIMRARPSAFLVFARFFAIV
jgi:hypothetical protein